MTTRPDGGPAIAAEHAVHLDTVELEGHRYVASADLGLGRPVPLMVHGNARVYLSLVHSVAEELLLGRPLPKVEDYGYTARGKSSIAVPALRLGGVTFEGITDVPVFDFSDDPTPVQGMLGTQFLTSARAAVDFASNTLLLAVAASGEPDPALLARGYRALRTVALPDGRMTIDVFFPVLERAASITLSTVADALMLHRPLFEGRVPMRPAGRDHSPSGTSPAVFASEGVGFEVEGTAFESAASFQDLAEYGNVTEAELQTAGMLGFDWMRAHAALLDYANQYLYILT